jgi:ABC-type multidrug transport system ATPase subunit/ABC-type multidrug transport system permease subunit
MNRLEWSNIKCLINNKVILNNQNGLVNSGEFLSILGCSGSGKTTLLNILSGRLNFKNITITGQILYNNTNIKHLGKNVAYVMQRDYLLENLTVTESLCFLKKLSGNNRYNIETLINTLLLSECQKTPVRLLSGGEKKRLAIALELIQRPRILFLDEPTSGLDSFTAFTVINSLKSFASNNNLIIIATLHQPSSELYNLIDKLIIINKGHLIYNGYQSNAINYFNKLGYNCPYNYNPADYFITLSQKIKIPLNIQKQQPILIKTLIQTKKYPNCIYSETYILTHRYCLNYYRDTTSIFTRIGINIFLNIFFGLIFKNAGNSKDLMTHFGSIVQIAISAMFASTQPVLLTFPIERKIFIREYFNGYYRVISYFIAKTLVEIPLSFFLTLLTVIIRYWLLNLQGNFWKYIGILFLLDFVAGSMALFLGCLTKNIKVAIELSPLIFVPQIMFAGFFIKITQIPLYLRWCQYVCILKYIINLLLINEFQDCHSLECNQLFNDNNINKGDEYLYLIILTTIFILFRLLSLVFLKNNSRHF